jgi:hypothetical protein
LQARIGYFVTDNATNNDTAINEVLRRLCPLLTETQRRSRRLRCLGHVINLAAKAFLYGTEFDAFEKDAEYTKEHTELSKELNLWRKRGPVGRLHNVVTFICRSPQRREKFAQITEFSNTEKGDYDHLKLISDNATRWNSLYSMINRALLLQTRIDSFCVKYKDQMHGAANSKRAQTDEEKERLLTHDILTNDDWKALAEVKSVLEKFFELTKRAESAKLSSDRGVLSNYIVTLNQLLVHVQEKRDSFTAAANNPDFYTPAIEHLRVCTVNCWRS